MDQSAIDQKMMRRCVELSATAADRRELPFACVISRGGEVVAEAINRVVQDADVTRHAEIVAISEAQKILGRSDLSDCTIYSNVEPCPMCSFPIRETRIGRVVYAISSPMMGGMSKWNVLSDHEISNAMPEVFGDAPEVAAGLQYRDAAAVWRRWNPIFWLGIRLRGCLADPTRDDADPPAAAEATPADALACGVYLNGLDAKARGGRRGFRAGGYSAAGALAQYLTASGHAGNIQPIRDVMTPMSVLWGLVRVSTLCDAFHIAPTREAQPIQRLRVRPGL